MITSLLFILLYALVALLCLLLVFYIVELFIAIPPQIKKIIYAIVGVLLLIQIVQLFVGGSLWFPLPMRR